MALDLALRDHAERHGGAVLRLYRWSADTISFGANEAAAKHWDRARLDADAVPQVRRPTGGRAVWHAADDLTYAVAAPLAAWSDITSAYVAIHEALADALRGLGLAVALAPAPPRLPGLRRGACFDVAVGGELLIDGRKVVGSAQAASRGALLQHGAIARRERGATLARYARTADPRPLDVAPPLPSAETLADAIVRSWSARGAPPVAADLSTWAVTAAESHAERFRDPSWTWRR